MKRDASHGPASDQRDPGVKERPPGEVGADGSSTDGGSAEARSAEARSAQGPTGTGSRDDGRGGDRHSDDHRSGDLLSRDGNEAWDRGCANARPAAAVPSAVRNTEAGDPAAGPGVRLPSLDTLTGESDFSAFMQPHVDPGVRVLALKKLFTDPRFNRMDGLDVYIDDYGKPDPIEPAFLKRLNQARTLNLVRDEEPEVAGAAPDEWRTAGTDPASAGTEGSADTEHHPDPTGKTDPASMTDPARMTDPIGNTDTTGRSDRIGETDAGVSPGGGKG